ncbi:acyl transferase [Reichenbachiella sp. MALMAid0571]|uniref:LuxE/PaaK family acyltransferase n=1 Tax=Reichenbachiella sp. MALMAid0571 TaxID=3143939 RepID=UPI0032DFAE50
MNSLNDFKKSLFNKGSNSFEDIALEIFNYQYHNNLVYGDYIRNLNISPDHVHEIKEIPFLPIEFFKSFEVKTGDWKLQKKFLSSGTTSSVRSCHLVEDTDFYHLVSRDIYEKMYVDEIKDTVILALLPSYQEQGDSGLVDMIDFFIENSDSEFSGYYLYDYENLLTTIENASKDKGNVVLFGVSFALLDFSEHIKKKFPNLIIIETGGMKGRRDELTKEELHAHLKKKFGVETIHSEYGMTELMSQAYSKGAGQFEMSKWMRVIIRDINDPFNFLQKGKIGGINVIDLANIHSCSFIETKDIGMINNDNKFEVLGRIDNSDIRGCNLLVS